MRRKPWKRSDEAQLANLAATGSIKQIAEALDRTPLAIRKRLSGKKIRLQNDGRFKPGHKPAKPAGNPPGPKFEKGYTPHNAKPDGATRLKPVGKNKFVKEIKVNGRWVSMRRHVWELNHGPIPSDHVVIVNGPDPFDCDVANLSLVSRKGMADQNRNAEKASETMKGHWKTVKTLESIGSTSSKLKLKSQRKKQKFVPMLVVDQEALSMAGNREY